MRLSNTTTNMPSKCCSLHTHSCVKSGGTISSYLCLNLFLPTLSTKAPKTHTHDLLPGFSLHTSLKDGQLLSSLSLSLSREAFKKNNKHNSLFRTRAQSHSVQAAAAASLHATSKKRHSSKPSLSPPSSRLTTTRWTPHQARLLSTPKVVSSARMASAQNSAKRKRSNSGDAKRR